MPTYAQFYDRLLDNRRLRTPIADAELAEAGREVLIATARSCVAMMFRRKSRLDRLPARKNECRRCGTFQQVRPQQPVA